MFKVLIVDDENSVIELLESLIDWEALGYTICGTASNGEEALKILKQCNPDLALIDIRMPKINGLQLLHQASEMLYLKTKFIILSAYSDFNYAKTAMRYKVKDYILKPIDDEEIVETLKRVSSEIINDIHKLKAERNKEKFEANNYINSLIKYEMNANIADKCREILDLNNNLFKCVLIEINEFEKWMNDFDDMEIYKKRLTVRKVIENTVGSEQVLNIFDDDVNRFGLIITQEAFNNEEQYLKNLAAYINRECKCSVSVALSEKSEDIQDMSKLYKHAFTALQYRLFQMNDEILYYDRIKNISLDYNFYESNPEALLQDIKNKNIDGIKNKINDVFNEFYKRKCASEVIENYIENIEFEILKHIHAHNGNIDEIIKKLKNISTIVGKVSVNFLKEEFYRLCLDMSDYYKSVSIRSSKDVIIEIKDYVHKNYERDLKLQEIAKDYFINPVYLGKVFTKSVGMHFNEYLNNVRIEEAKKLLRRTDMKISNIASKVGYSDSDYFVSKFKVITGNLPSDYRRKNHVENKM